MFNNKLAFYCHGLAIDWQLIGKFARPRKATERAGFKGLLVILSFIYAYEYKSIYIRYVKPRAQRRCD